MASHTKRKHKTNHGKPVSEFYNFSQICLGEEEPESQTHHSNNCHQQKHHSKNKANSKKHNNRHSRQKNRHKNRHSSSSSSSSSSSTSDDEAPIVVIGPTG